MACLMESGMMDGLERASAQELQRQIQSLILATDIARQQEFLTAFQVFNLYNRPSNLVLKNSSLVLLGLFEWRFTRSANCKSPSLRAADCTQVCRHFQSVSSVGVESGLEFASQRRILSSRRFRTAFGPFCNSNVRPLHFFRFQNSNWFLPLYRRSTFRRVAPFSCHTSFVDHVELSTI